MKTTVLIIVTFLALGCASTSGKVTRVQFTWQQNLINVGTTLLGAAVTGAIYYKATKQMGDDLEGALKRERQAIPVITIPFP